MENYPLATELAQDIACQKLIYGGKIPFLWFRGGWLPHFRKTWKFRKINQSSKYLFAIKR